MCCSIEENVSGFIIREKIMGCIWIIEYVVLQNANFKEC
jgi:hypothetical protein